MFLLATVCFVLRFTGSSLAAFEVSVPQRRVLAVRGRPVVLGCSYAPSLGSSLEVLVVTWQKAEDNLVLHSFYHGQDQLDKQNARYRNRTSMFRPLLGAGNASLRLDRVGPQDSGRYRCSVDSLLGNGKAEVQLEYAAFYTEPKLNIQVHPSNISLEYQSEGYPAPRTSVTLKDPGPVVNLSFTLRNAALGQVLERPVCLRLVWDWRPSHTSDSRETECRRHARTARKNYLCVTLGGVETERRRSTRDKLRKKAGGETSQSNGDPRTLE
ncbi:hypothetical protein ANANG_G00003370 [Anguilla anguilla]|uniref:Ig-like domain-containing protein n=1 Tax=Anguilla anguilla TaxID=7936 RepID=A0A9D3S5Y6_ANGAN|nr:hypothetical protein ANANG_G00003370 [Anguilla anguilla]